MKPPCGIDDHGIVTELFCVGNALFRNFNGIALTFFKTVRLRFARNDLKLLDRGGTIHVARDEQGFLALLFQIHRKFSAKRSLSRTLKSAHHDDGGKFGAYDQLAVRRAHQRGQFLIYDFNDLLRRT